MAGRAVACFGAVPAAALGQAAGVFNTLQRVGAVVAVAVVTAVFDANGALTSPSATTSGYRPALMVAAALSVAGAVIAVWCSGSRARR